MIRDATIECLVDSRVHALVLFKSLLKDLHKLFVVLLKFSILVL